LHIVSFRLTKCPPEGDHKVFKVIEVRLCATLPKSDGYDLMRLDKDIMGTTESTTEVYLFFPNIICYSIHT